MRLRPPSTPRLGFALLVVACVACTAANPDYAPDARKDAQISTDTDTGAGSGGVTSAGGALGGAGGSSGSGGSGDASPAGPDAGVTTGLVARWSMDEGKGTMAKDTVGGNHATMAGATWATPGAPPTATKAACLAFGGDSTAEADTAGLPMLNVPMSITLWMRASSLSSGKRTALALLREGSNPAAVQLGQDGNAAAMWFYGDSGTLLRTGALTANTWSFIAYTFDGTTHRLSVGTGAPVSIATAAPAAAATILYFASYGSMAQRFVGHLDDVRIYDRALSSSEIRALAQP